MNSLALLQTTPQLPARLLTPHDWCFSALAPEGEGWGQDTLFGYIKRYLSKRLVINTTKRPRYRCELFDLFVP